MSAQPPTGAASPQISDQRSWSLRLVIALTSIALLGAAILFWFDPARHAFYPVCLFKKLTGYDCPGCGGLRAMHHLLRGELWHAVELNALAVIALPLLAGWGVVAWVRSFSRCRATDEDEGRPTLSTRPDTLSSSPRQQTGRSTWMFWVWLAVGVIVVFGVVRNLSLWPFGVTPG